MSKSEQNAKVEYIRGLIGKKALSSIKNIAQGLGFDVNNPESAVYISGNTLATTKSGKTQYNYL